MPVGELVASVTYKIHPATPASRETKAKESRSAGEFAPSLGSTPRAHSGGSQARAGTKNGGVLSACYCHDYFPSPKLASRVEFCRVPSRL